MKAKFKEIYSIQYGIPSLQKPHINVNRIDVIYCRDNGFEFTHVYELPAHWNYLKMLQQIPITINFNTSIKKSRAVKRIIIMKD